MDDRLRFAPLQSPLYRALHDAVDLIPCQLELLGNRLLAGNLQPFNRHRLKQLCETAQWCRPRHFHHPYSMLRALAPRRFGVEDRLVLTGVQMAPSPFPLMVMQFAWRPTFRAWPIVSFLMRQMYMYLALFQLQFN